MVGELTGRGDRRPPSSSNKDAPALATQAGGQYDLVCDLLFVGICIGNRVGRFLKKIERALTNCTGHQGPSKPAKNKKVIHGLTGDAFLCIARANNSRKQCARPWTNRRVRNIA